MAKHQAGSIRSQVQARAATTVHMHIYVTEEEAKLINRAKNGEPTSTWARTVLVQAAMEQLAARELAT